MLIRKCLFLRSVHSSDLICLRVFIFFCIKVEDLVVKVFRILFIYFKALSCIQLVFFSVDFIPFVGPRIIDPLHVCLQLYLRVTTCVCMYVRVCIIKYQELEMLICIILKHANHPKLKSLSENNGKGKQKTILLAMK